MWIEKVIIGARRDTKFTFVPAASSKIIEANANRVILRVSWLNYAVTPGNSCDVQLSLPNNTSIITPMAVMGLNSVVFNNELDGERHGILVAQAFTIAVIGGADVLVTEILNRGIPLY